MVLYMNAAKQLLAAPIFQSNMVLQRNKTIVIWGNAPEQSTVSVSFNNIKADSITDSFGKWKCNFPAQKAGEGYTLKISCSNDDTIILTNISIGDIWLACGQSNMEFHLRYDAEWEKVKNYTVNPQIHMYNVPQLAFEGHQKSTEGYGIWFQEKEIGFETFSAPAYSFARHIQPILDVPIAIIGCNWGGTTAAAWMDESYLEGEPLSIYLDEYQDAMNIYPFSELEEKSKKAWDFEDSPEHARDFMPLLYGRDEQWQKEYMENHKEDPIIPMGPWNINRPGGLYHQMLEPLIPFSIKGVLWYQGENDAGRADMYDKLFSSLIQCWRNKWEDQIPFLFVQLAPFERWLDCNADNYPELRYQQEVVSKTVDNTAMVSIMDIGSYYDIHPKQKLEVGRRLALLARGKVYGEKILCESPEFSQAVRADKEIVISFLHCETHNKGGKQLLIKPHNNPNEPSINGFTIIQNEIEIPIDSIDVKENTIILKAESLNQSPCTISFAWMNYVEVNIYNEASLPVKPFRCTI